MEENYPLPKKHWRVSMAFQIGVRLSGKPFNATKFRRTLQYSAIWPHQTEVLGHQDWHSHSAIQKRSEPVFLIQMITNSFKILPYCRVNSYLWKKNKKYCTQAVTIVTHLQRALYSFPGFVTFIISFIITSTQDGWPSVQLLPSFFNKQGNKSLEKLTTFPQIRWLDWI